MRNHLFRAWTAVLFSVTSCTTPLPGTDQADLTLAMEPPDQGTSGDIAVASDLWSPDLFVGPDLAKPVCMNGVKDNSETDVDCGGGTCPPCPVGRNCVVDTDCGPALYCAGPICTQKTVTGGACKTDHECLSKVCCGICADTKTEAANCGGCGLKCSNSHIMNPTCSGGVCDGACDKNFGDCDGDKLKNGCETDLTTDRNNCAMCGKACPVLCDQSICIAPRGVSAGPQQTTCAVFSNAGRTRCWGAGLYAPMTPSVTPLAIDGTNQIEDLAIGSNYYCGHTSLDTVLCWGTNSTGQLGNGMVGGSTFVPQMVPGLQKVRHIAAGDSHTCVVDTQGKVYCWGSNGGGKLGDGTTMDRASPVQVPDLANLTMIDVTSGWGHTCAVEFGRAVWCWGDNRLGQLGDGSGAQQQLRPVLVVNLPNNRAVEAKAGADHTCARDPNDNVWCWGNNASGQLGDGTTTNRPTPVQVKMLAGAVELCAGGGFSCARLNTDSVVCWGLDSLGQLGDMGNGMPRMTPVPVVNLDNAKQIVCGGTSACAKRADDSIWCWGHNGSGQLGNGNMMNSTVPVKVIF